MSWAVGTAESDAREGDGTAGGCAGEDRGGGRRLATAAARHRAKGSRRGRSEAQSTRDRHLPTKKTEVFLAKAALTEDPAFFGHQFQGLTTRR